MSEPLREGINKLVLRYLQKKLETGEAIDVVEMTHEMAQNLIDMSCIQACKRRVGK